MVIQRTTISNEEEFKKLISTDKSVIVDINCHKSEKISFYNVLLKKYLGLIQSKSRTIGIAIDVPTDDMLKYYSDETEKFICGIAPKWKKYESKQDFENYYKNSQMMRSIYCNELDDFKEPANIYVDIDNNKYIVSWTSKGNKDSFKYKKPNINDIGLINMIKDVYNYQSDDGEWLIPNIKLIINDSIPYFGFRRITNHIKNLGVSPNSLIFEHGF